MLTTYSYERVDNRNRMKHIFENSDGTVKKHKQNTYWIQKYCEEKFTSSDTFIQFLGSSWILFVENSVGEQPTGLSWEDLMKRGESSALTLIN